MKEKHSDFRPPRVIAVVGPTASGKSSLAMKLALKYGGEIISCDSMQIYRGMDIGTAKDSDDDMTAVPHHMIDIADPSENFSCSDYAVMASACADDMIARGKLPIFCGGTGLYLDSVLSGDRYSPAAESEPLRTELSDLDDDTLRLMLRTCDSRSYSSADIVNRRRLIRALEIFYSTGLPKSLWDERSKAVPPRYRALKIALGFSDRDELYRRIDDRVDAMFAAGLADEAIRLYRSGLSETAGQAIGYKELFRCFDLGRPPLSAAGDVKTATRHYAKRQMTWFRRDREAVWLEGSDPCLFDRACAAVNEFLGAE